MDLPLALHTAARRFCADRHSRWSGEYMELGDTGEDTVPASALGWDHSKAAYGLFPRYRLDQAIENEVERLTGAAFHSLEEARKSLLEAGRHSLLPLIGEFQRSSEACAALNDELQAFEQYIAGLEATQLGQIEPLPYRRVLGDSESEQLRKDLRARWGVTEHYWYPLSESSPHTNVIAFHQELWEKRDGTSVLLQAVLGQGVERCFLLREGPPDYEIDSSLIDPRYRGDESFLTSDFEWLVYSSHESSIAVAGWLADFYRARWRDWESVAYGGPFHTPDLRGTWGILKR